MSLHAYVLMTNHVHFLMTPSDAEGVSRVMQSLGRRYVQYVNKEYRRSGTLWEGRHKASIVDAIRKIQRAGTTILLVEQDASIALDICDRGYLLEDGRIELQGTKEELLNNPHVKEAYLGIT